MKRLILLLFGAITLSGCIANPPEGMTWDSYYEALFILQQTYNKADIAGCIKLGSVSGSSYDSIGDAKDIAADNAVRKGADVLYFDSIDAGSNWDYVADRGGNIYDAYGTAYKCK